GFRAIGLAVVLTLLLLIPFPNPYVEVLGLSTIVLCWLEVVRLRERPQACIVPALALFTLCLRIYAPQAILNGVMLAAPVTVLFAYYYKSQRREVGLGALAFVLLFAHATTLSDWPPRLIGGLAAAPFSLAFAGPRRFRPPARLLIRTMLIAVP